MTVILQGVRFVAKWYGIICRWLVISESFVFLGTGVPTLE